MSGQQPYDNLGGGQPAYPQVPTQQQNQYSAPSQLQPRRLNPQDLAPAAAATAQAGHQHRAQPAGKKYALRGAEAFWYVLMCIPMGAAYFQKLPGKKAACEIFSELQLDGQGPSESYALRGAEVFWYTLMCIAFGAGYFAKVVAKKAQWEVVAMMQAAPGEYREAISRALDGSASGRVAL